MISPDIVGGHDDRTLARDIIEVHGAAAAAVARGNARLAAVAGQLARAKAWIRVLAIIQAELSEKAIRGSVRVPSVSAGSAPSKDKHGVK